MTSLCNYPLPTCLMNASGCHSTTAYQLQTLAHVPDCAMVVSKSATIKPNWGNDEPRIYLDDQQCINSMGLPNGGLDYYNRIKIEKLYMQSVHPQKLEDLQSLLNTTAPFIEVNLSCPNVDNNRLHLEKYLETIDAYDSLKICGIKLPPLFYAHEFDAWAAWLIKYKIDFITCCNGVPNCLLIDEDTTRIHPHEGLGAMSFKPLALANVYQFHQRLKHTDIDIIGCGDIRTGQDVYEYLLCGAKAVQIGTTLLREGHACFQRINKELQTILINKKTNLKSIQGQLKVCPKL